MAAKHRRAKRASRDAASRSVAADPIPTDGAVDVPLVELDLPPDPGRHWLSDLTQRWPIHVRFRVCRPLGGEQNRMLHVLELNGSPGDLGAAERYLRRNPELTSLTVLPVSLTRRYVRAIGTASPACRTLLEAGATCTACRFIPGTVNGQGDRWTVVMPRTLETLRVVAGIRSEAREGDTSILRLRQFVPPRSLTPRQASALETAHRLGYYAFPRRTNLQEIARRLGVSRATTAELLRRAEGKMLASEFVAT